MTDVFHNEAADALDRERVRLAIRTIAGLDEPSNDNKSEQENEDIIIYVNSLAWEIFMTGCNYLIWWLGIIASCGVFLAVVIIPVIIAITTTHDRWLMLYFLYPWLFSAFTTLIKRNKWYNERFR